MLKQLWRRVISLSYLILYFFLFSISWGNSSGLGRIYWRPCFNGIEEFIAVYKCYVKVYSIEYCKVSVCGKWFCAVFMKPVCSVPSPSSWSIINLTLVKNFVLNFVFCQWIEYFMGFISMFLVITVTVSDQWYDFQTDHSYWQRFFLIVCCLWILFVIKCFKCYKWRKKFMIELSRAFFPKFTAANFSKSVTQIYGQKS